MTVALGNSWSHAVNTRLLMQYRNGNMRTVYLNMGECYPLYVPKGVWLMVSKSRSKEFIILHLLFSHRKQGGGGIFTCMT